MVSNYFLDDPLSTTQGPFNFRQKAPGPFHVRSIAVSKAGNQILLFGSRSDDEQTKQHDSGHKEEPVRRNQGNRHREQRGRVVERMPDLAIAIFSKPNEVQPADDRGDDPSPETRNDHRWGL